MNMEHSAIQSINIKSNSVSSTESFIFPIILFSWLSYIIMNQHEMLSCQLSCNLHLRVNFILNQFATKLKSNSNVAQVISLFQVCTKIISSKIVLIAILFQHLILSFNHLAFWVHAINLAFYVKLFQLNTLISRFAIKLIFSLLININLYSFSGSI